MADEIRLAFDTDAITEERNADEKFRFAFSVEGLRATTRVMHTLAWLINFRAFLDGELTELHVRRHSRLPKDRPPESTNLALLDSDTKDLVLASQHLHARVERLEREWRAQYEMRPPAVHRLRERLERSYSAV